MTLRPECREQIVLVVGKQPETVRTSGAELLRDPEGLVVKEPQEEGLGHGEELHNNCTRGNGLQSCKSRCDKKQHVANGQRAAMRRPTNTELEQSWHLAKRTVRLAIKVMS